MNDKWKNWTPEEIREAHEDARMRGSVENAKTLAAAYAATLPDDSPYKTEWIKASE